MRHPLQLGARTRGAVTKLRPPVTRTQVRTVALLRGMASAVEADHDDAGPAVGQLARAGEDLDLGSPP